MLYLAQSQTRWGVWLIKSRIFCLGRLWGKRRRGGDSIKRQERGDERGYMNCEGSLYIKIRREQKKGRDNEKA